METFVNLALVVI